MKYSKYPVLIDDSQTRYEFFSEGPAGRVTKVIFYEHMMGNLFNLAFGDWNEEEDKIDDTIRSNNGDRDKVLATVAESAIDFTNRFPGSIIYTEGSTPGRTRLYQMGIASNLEEIVQMFEIEGSINGEWEIFQQGRNYDAFLARRK